MCVCVCMYLRAGVCVVCERMCVGVCHVLYIISSHTYRLHMNERRQGFLNTQQALSLFLPAPEDGW